MLGLGQQVSKPAEREGATPVPVNEEDKPVRVERQGRQGFQDLKRMLSTAPVLAAPSEKEPLFVYIASTSRSISTMVVVECPEKGKIQAVQHPAYYLSEVRSASK